MIQIDEDDLQELTQLCARQQGYEADIEILEKQLADFKAKLTKVSMELIPEKMMTLGVTELKLINGSKVTIKPYYSAKIPDERKPEAFTWLRGHGYASLIKREVSLNFGMGDDNKAKEVVDALVELGYQPQDTTAVHPMTLKSFVKEAIESGEPIPRDLFGVFEGKKTTIK